MVKESSDPFDSETTVDTRRHVLYCGVTQSGKTTLARWHARQLASVDYDVVVYDPVQTQTAGGYWPENAKVFDDEEKFIEYLHKAQGTEERPIFIFVDEAADIFGQRHYENHKLPRRIRHQWVFLRLISQRPKMLPPDVRTQCGNTYLFMLAKDDAREVCADAGHGPETYNIPLDKGDFLLLESGSASIEQANCFTLVD